MKGVPRLVCSNLDAVQSVGHKSMKLVEHYGTLSSTLQGDSISKIETFLKQKSNQLANECAVNVPDPSDGSEMISGISNF